MDHTGHSLFAGRADRLEKNVYESVKGQIRLALLEQDLHDFCSGFSSFPLRTLDIGGGSGRFARICAERGHGVLLFDSSEEMLALAEREIERIGLEGKISLMHGDYLDETCTFPEQFDLVLLHGAAEWMTSPEAAIEKACGCVRAGGYLSLLVFNKDRLTLKRGINGQLLESRKARHRNENTLMPPGPMSPAEVIHVLEKRNGKILLKSGIRVFHKFFRQGVSEEVLTPAQWLQQERLFYRQEPFASLGEHTHFIWQADNV